MIRFLYDRQPVTLEDAPADLTVLDWLRLEARRPGTKEGCASGDCGACTAVMGVPAGGADAPRLDYQAFNTCITLVGALHGRQLLTVENLADGDTLHPVQQALVDHHGSQCGFCTPGFVMSLFALWHRQAVPEPESEDALIEHYLGGNLCRCTGYRPIIDAARALLAQPVEDRFAASRDSTLAALASLTSAPGVTPETPPDTPPGDTADEDMPAYLRPTTLDALLALKQRHPDAPLAGGTTDLALDVTQSLKRYHRIIDIGAVTALNEITVDAHRVRLGAGVSLARLQAFFAEQLPAVGEYLLRFAAAQVRARATLGGNLATASPIGDLPPVLLALDADIELAGAAGVRVLPLADFFLDYRKTALAPDEIIQAVMFDLPASRTTIVKAYKVSKRRDDDISTVAAVFCLEIDGECGRVDEARLAFGGMAAIPRRSAPAESALLGKVFDAQSLADAKAAIADDFSPLSDARASAAYRLTVAANLLERCYHDWRSDGPVSIDQLLEQGGESAHG